jgi:hypothetical protein
MDPQKNIHLNGSSERDPKGLKRKRTFKKIVLREATAPNQKTSQRLKLSKHDSENFRHAHHDFDAKFATLIKPPGHHEATHKTSLPAFS